VRETVYIYIYIYIYIYTQTHIHEGNSEINFRFVGKKKYVVLAPKRTLNSKKQRLLLLYAYPHTFSLRRVGVNCYGTWTLPSPLPPAVRYVFWERKGILFTEFMARGATITSEVYCETMNKLRRLIKKKRRAVITKGVVFLQDNARPHTVARTNILTLWPWSWTFTV